MENGRFIPIYASEGASARKTKEYKIDTQVKASMEYPEFQKLY